MFKASIDNVKNFSSDITIEVTFTCPTIKKTTTVEVDSYAFGGSEQECEVCGSHGERTVEVRCPICNKSHEIELNSW